MRDALAMDAITKAVLIKLIDSIEELATDVRSLQEDVQGGNPDYQHAVTERMWQLKAKLTAGMTILSDIESV